MRLLGCESGGRCHMLPVVALVLLSAVTVAGVSDVKPTAALAASSSSAKVITVPLVPHHIQRQRRLDSMVESELRSELGEGYDEEMKDSEELSDYHDVRRREVAQQVGGLYQGYGTHYIDLWCGSPPQRQTVIVDTGSGVTAFPCSGCNDCGVPKYHIDKLFETDESTTFRPSQCSGGNCVTRRGSCDRSKNQCRISMSYAEGSRWDAYEAVDRCYVGGPHNIPLVPVENIEQGLDKDTGDDLDPNHANKEAFDLVFGCQTLLTGLFKTQLADGIMGMDNYKESYWQQMYDHGKLSEKKFSLCFSRPPTSTRDGSEAGAMTLGGFDRRLHRDPTPSGMVYTTNASGGRSGFFSVFVRNIYFRKAGGGDSAKSTHPSPLEGVIRLDVNEHTLNMGGVIVDSGTTDTYWNQGISRAFIGAFRAMTGKDYNHDHVEMTQEEVDALPTVLFQLKTDPNGNQDALNVSGNDPNIVIGLAGDLDPSNPHDVILAMPPSHYMEFDASKGTYVNRFYVTEGGGSVLGANAMMGHDILFDIDNDRIGWAESDCDYTKALEDGGFDSVLGGKDDDKDENNERTEKEGGDDGGETSETESETGEEPTEGDDNDDENDDEGWEDDGVGDDEPTDDQGDDATSEKEDEQPNPAPTIPPPPPPKVTAAPTAAYVPDPESISSSDDVEKKEKDTEGSDPHDMDSPPNNGIRPPTSMADANEQLQKMKDSCDTPICRGIAIGSTLFSLLVLVCCCRCLCWCCCGRRSRAKTVAYQPAPSEVELSGNGYDSYKDEPARNDSFYDEDYDDDDGEFDGDFKR